MGVWDETLRFLGPEPSAAVSAELRPSPQPHSTPSPIPLPGPLCGFPGLHQSSHWNPNLLGWGTDTLPSHCPMNTLDLASTPGTYGQRQGYLLLAHPGALGTPCLDGGFAVEMVLPPRRCLQIAASVCDCHNGSPSFPHPYPAFSGI